MADQRRWFKLWASAPSDEHLQRLPPALRWAWVALGVYTKVHGTSGIVTISPSNSVLAAELGVEPRDLLCTLLCLPSICLGTAPVRWPHGHDKLPTCDGEFVRGSYPLNMRGRQVAEQWCTRNGTLTVTWENWRKYQEDSTMAERGRASRSKRRREESSTKSSTPPVPPRAAGGDAVVALSDDPAALSDGPSVEQSPRHAALHATVPAPPAGLIPGSPPRTVPKKSRPTAGLHPDGFARFWAKYPRKVGRPRALKAWRTLKLEGQVDAVTKGLTRWHAWWTSQQTPPDRVPYPATWLNDERWKDEPVGGPEQEDMYAKFPRD